MGLLTAGDEVKLASAAVLVLELIDKKWSGWNGTDGAPTGPTEMAVNPNILKALFIRFTERPTD